MTGKLATTIAYLTLLVGGARVWAEEELTGQVIKLSDVTEKRFEVNQDGLVVVIVGDSGSRPPKDIKIDFGRQYKQIGKLQGAQTDDGKFQAGGGFTWYLLKPINAGPGPIKVTYTENDDKGTEVKREYEVDVTKGDE